MNDLDLLSPPCARHNTTTMLCEPGFAVVPIHKNMSPSKMTEGQQVNKFGMLDMTSKPDKLHHFHALVDYTNCPQFNVFSSKCSS